MVGFLKGVSVAYLVIAWSAFAIFFKEADSTTFATVAFLAVLTASIPAAALFAFAQMVGDVHEAIWLLRDIRQALAKPGNDS